MVRRKRNFELISFAISVILLAGCTPKSMHVNSALTLGNIQRVLVAGVTTKTDVLKEFGAPNITTRNNKGEEVWTYQRSAQGAEARGGFFSSRLHHNSRMMTLIVSFDQRDKVVDFRNRSSIF